MKRFLRRGIQEIEILGCHDCSPRDAFMEFHDIFSAISFLRKLADDPLNMVALRGVYAAASYAKPLNVFRLTDHQLLEQLAHQIVSGHIKLAPVVKQGYHFARVGTESQTSDGPRQADESLSETQQVPTPPGQQPLPTDVQTAAPMQSSEQSREPPSETVTIEEETKTAWIEVELIDGEGEPLKYEPYWIRLPDGEVREGRLDQNGFVRFEDIEPGICAVKLLNFDGSDVKISTQSEPVSALTSAGASSSAASQKADDDQEATPDERKMDWIEIEVLSDEGIPAADELYQIQFPSGEIRQGRLDQNGFARIEGIEPGICIVGFQNIDTGDWKRM
ncbi:hypothetical protein ACFL6S_02180 [Candidatus Poribacteria bacterium]